MPGRRYANRLSPEERAEIEIAQEIEEISDAIAAEMGAAPGARRVSDDRLVELWGQSDPNVDFDAFRQALMTGPLDPALLDPNSDRALEIVKAFPPIAETLAAGPFDEAMADMLTPWVHFPFRREILEPWLEDDPSGAVAEADRLDGLWQRRAPAPRQAEPAQQPPAFDTHGPASVSNAPAAPPLAQPQAPAPAAPTTNGYGAMPPMSVMGG